MKKQMGIKYKIANIENQQVGRINFLSEHLLGIKIGLAAHQYNGIIKQKELWILVTGECIETHAIVSIDDLLETTLYQVSSRKVVKRNLSEEEITNWSLSDVQKARLDVFRRNFKSQKNYVNYHSISVLELKNMNLAENYNLIVGLLSRIVAWEINDKDAKKYFNTIDRLQIIQQILFELSPQCIHFEPNKVEVRIKNIKKVIGKAAYKHIVKHHDLYVNDKELNPFKIDNMYDLEKFYYDKETNLFIAKNISEKNKSITKNKQQKDYNE